MLECKEQTSKRSVGSPRQWRKVSVTKNDHFLKLCQQGQLCRRRRREARRRQLRKPLNVPAQTSIKAPRYHYKGHRPECSHGLVLLDNFCLLQKSNLLKIQQRSPGVCSRTCILFAYRAKQGPREITLRNLPLLSQFWASLFFLIRRQTNI